MKNNIENLNDLRKERELIHQKIEVDKLKIIKEIDDLKIEIVKSFVGFTLKNISTLFHKNKK